MKQQINEIRRMQQLAGIISEGEDQQVDKVEQVVDKVEDSIEAKVDKLTPKQVEQLKAELSKLGINANTPVEQVVDKIEGQLSEVEGEDPKQKIANALSNIGTGLIGSLLVPIIPVAIGSLGVGVAAGFGITIAAAGLLIGLAKVLGKKEGSSEFGNN